MTRDDAGALEGLEVLLSSFRFGKTVLRHLAASTEKHIETTGENPQDYIKSNPITGRLPDTYLTGAPGGLPPSEESTSKLRTHSVGDDMMLHLHMMKSLEKATTYAWAPHVVETVAAAAESLSQETVMSPFAVSELATNSWWWFRQPIPIRSVSAPGHIKPTVAMLTTKAGYKGKTFPLGHTSGLWFQTFVNKDMGPTGPVALAGASWFWPDGMALKDLVENFKQKYSEVEYPDQRQLAGAQVTCDHAFWFCGFAMAAACWLRQRVLTRGREPGIRGARRRLKREFELLEMPTVEVIKLRRAEVEEPGGPNPDAEARHYRMRFIVHGHWRNQWYAKAATHAPKWIESYVKGPANKPLKDPARVYSVSR